MYQPKHQELILESGTVNLFAVADRCRRWFVPGVLLLADYGAVVLAVWTTYMLRVHLVTDLLPVQQINYIHDIYSYVYIIMPLAVIFFMHFDNMYVRRMPIWQQIERISKVAIYSCLFILALLYFLEPAKHLPRIFMLMMGVFVFLYLLLGRYFVKKILIAANLWQIPIVLIGSGKTAEILINSFKQDDGISYKVVGIIEDNEDNPENIGKIFQGIPIIGSFAKAEEAVVRTGVRNVLLALPGCSREFLVDMVYRLQPYVRNITFVPDILGVPVGSMELETLFDERIVLLKVKNKLSLLRNRIFKRVFDVVAGMVICLLSLPIMGIIALMIKSESSGSIFYTAKRLGENGKDFFCYKFCTMYENNAEILTDYLKNNREARLEWDEYAKLRSYDPRVTHVGKWLRKFSLDELPQILNVLKGEMSLVGPRPYLPAEKDKMDFFTETIITVKPGITGLWQVSGRNEVSFEGRLKIDCWYIRNWSLWLDMIILLKTIKVVLTRKGAY